MHNREPTVTHPFCVYLPNGLPMLKGCVCASVCMCVCVLCVFVCVCVGLCVFVGVCVGLCVFVWFFLCSQLVVFEFIFQNRIQNTQWRTHSVTPFLCVFSNCINVKGVCACVWCGCVCACVCACVCIISILA